jgi:hypothetical protein
MGIIVTLIGLSILAFAVWKLREEGAPVAGREFGVLGPYLSVLRRKTCDSTQF